MKKTYECPKLEIRQIEHEDVITNSGFILPAMVLDFDD